VVFLSNHRAYSHASETRLIPLAKEFKSQGVEVVAINPNSPDGVRIDELGDSKYNDSVEEMTLYARDAGFPFPYLYGGGTQTTAKAYGCTLSLDDPKREPQVKAFLEKQHVATPARLKKIRAAEGLGPPNLFHTGANTDALVQALDPARPGPLPHTVLIAPRRTDRLPPYRRRRPGGTEERGAEAPRPLLYPRRSALSPR